MAISSFVERARCLNKANGFGEFGEALGLSGDRVIEAAVLGETEYGPVHSSEQIPTLASKATLALEQKFKDLNRNVARDPFYDSQSKKDLSQEDLQHGNNTDQTYCLDLDLHKLKANIAQAEASSTYNSQYPELPRVCISPFSAEFIPLKPNSYAALFDQVNDQEDGRPLSEDEFVKIDDGNMVLCNNALEDIWEEKEGLILFTHSEGEDKVFNDNILKPLQIDYSRMFKTPFDLGREFKGRNIYSPSQIVTRSNAKILEEGRKKTPIGWEERSNGSESNFAEDIRNFFKECCPNKPKKATKNQSSNKPLTKSQKKRSKKKLKKKMVGGQERDDSD
ncbi:unnamed protein product [Cuscuta campestris]|uniref:Uncharacterized protein n=1 Tax=Cuscuta campestris TaxID=132261 RepID=A0A484M3B1_9ASTE|nr:unnamed protein product [Cuscuta campestris]